MEMWIYNNFLLRVSIGHRKGLWSSRVAASPPLHGGWFAERLTHTDCPGLLCRQAGRGLSPTRRAPDRKRDCACHIAGGCLQIQAVCLESLCRTGSVSWLCAGWEVWDLVPKGECTSKSWHGRSPETDRRPTVTYGAFFSRHKWKGINHWEASQKLKFIYWLWGVKRQMWSVLNLLSFPAI